LIRNSPPGSVFKRGLSSLQQPGNIYSFARLMEINNKHTVFVTGADGFVGQFLIRRLINNSNYRLIVNSRFKPLHSIESKKVIRTTADLLDDDAIEFIFKKYKPRHVIHLAALARLADGERNPTKTYLTNYKATKKMVDLANKYQIESFLFVSSDLMRNARSVVGITKYLAEAYIQEQTSISTKFIILRLPNISWTPGSVHTIFKKLIEEDKPITVTHQDMSRRFVDRKIATEYIMLSLEYGHNNDIFVIDKQPEKIIELAMEMIDKSGKQLPVKFIGKQPGEKLAEESYLQDEIEDTGFNHLALLKKKHFEEKDISIAKKLLEQKTGFNLSEYETI